MANRPSDNGRKPEERAESERAEAETATSDRIDAEVEATAGFPFGWPLFVFALIAGLSVVVLLWWLIGRPALPAPPGEPKLTIEITGHEWWWEVRYLSDDPHRVFTTANEIHLPVGEPVRLKLDSADVIHSFWVPAIAGKTDLIPGRTNTTVLQATKAGTYRGQCAEFCGLQHANMAFVAVAQSPEEFTAWRKGQLAPSPEPRTKEAQAGKDIFMRSCAGCHTVRGTMARGALGPDLTHLMDRRTLAAGTLSNAPGHLAGWVANPDAIKPGSKMPRIPLEPKELLDLQAYLRTLE
ncbi:MAG: c-type cytochrome [Methyloligella sp. ZOD6]